MNNGRLWLFRGLVLVGGAVVLAAWFLPWWSIYIYEIGADSVIIHPWGLETRLREAEANLIASAQMPAWFAPMMWAFLAALLLALLLGMFLKDRNLRIAKFQFSIPSLLFGLSGCAYLVSALVAAVYAALRMQDFFGGVNFIGYTYIDLGEPYQTGADAGLLIGFYLTCGVGLYLILLAVLRNKIIGAPKASMPKPA